MAKSVKPAAPRKKPEKGPLVRYRDLQRDELDAEQRHVFDAIASGPRRSVPKIFHLYLQSADLCARVQALGAYCRYGTSLPSRHSELLILIVAKHWEADYEWEVHEGEARKAGVPEIVIKAIEKGERPEFEDRDDRLLYEFATTLFRNNDIPDALFEEAVNRFGRKTTTEIAGVLGYYSMLAIALKIFRVPGN